MSEVNKLQLVDFNKLNEILEIFKQDHDEKRVLQGITNKNEFELREGRENMEKTIGNRTKSNEDVGESIVKYLNKQQKIKRKHDREEEKEEEEEEENNPTQRKMTPTVKSEQQIMKFFKERHMKVGTNNILKLNTIKVTYPDLIEDLTHNATKPTSFNMSSVKRMAVLKELKKMNFPASYIHNKLIKSQYARLSSDSSSGSGGAESSQALLNSPRFLKLKQDYYGDRAKRRK